MKLKVNNIILQKKNFIYVKLASILKSIRIILNNLVELPFIILFGKTQNCSDNSNKLLIVNTGVLGDNILTFEFLIALHNSRKFDEVHLLIKEPYEQIYNFLNLPFTFIQWNKKKYKWNVFYKIKFIKELRKENYNIAFNITPERGVLNEELTLVSGAKNYWKIEKENKFINSFFISFFNDKYQTNFKVDSENEYDVFYQISSQLFGSKFSINYPNSLHTEKSSKRYIVIAPFASDIERSWYLKNYIELAHKLSSKYIIYFIGSSNQSKKFINLDTKDPNVYTLFGKLRLEEIPNFIQNAGLFIGNDSGLTHLALYLNIPLIAVIGGGMYGRFFPVKNGEFIKYFSWEMDCFGCGWNCLYKERYCLTQVNVDDIVQAAYNILEKNADKIEQN